MSDLLNHLTSSFAVASVLSDQNLMQKPDVLSRSSAVTRKWVVKRWTYRIFYSSRARGSICRRLNKTQLLQWEAELSVMLLPPCHHMKPPKLVSLHGTYSTLKAGVLLEPCLRI